MEIERSPLRSFAAALPSDRGANLAAFRDCGTINWVAGQMSRTTSIDDAAVPNAFSNAVIRDGADRSDRHPPSAARAHGVQVADFPAFR